MKMLREGIKRIVLFVMAVAVTISATTPEKAEALSPMAVYTGASRYQAFSYDLANYNVAWMPDYVRVPIVSNAGGVLGVYHIVCGLARAKGTDNYIFMVRQLMEPSILSVRYKKASGNKYTYAYGLSEYCGFVSVLPGLDDWTPKTKPSENKISVSLAADGAKSVGLSYDIVKSDLSMSSLCSSSQGLYGMIYDYVVHVVNPFYSNKYFREQSDQNCMALFHSNKSTINIQVTYEARFGASSTASANAIDVYKNAIYSKSGNMTLCFPAIPKN
ncbi:MAG: hypothetical protein IKS10_01345 [Lachnospiraceae bacterium]|nr:hypothetical protein [Lachnospiraceae bacterium]